MKRNLRIALCALLALSLLLAAGCTATPDAPSTSATPTAKQTPPPASTDGTPPPPANKYPDPNKKVKLSLFAGVTWLGFDTANGIIPQEIERNTGVSFDLTKATDSEQLSLMIASQELPDLVMTASQARIRELSDSDLCYPLEELIEKYCPDWEIPEATQKLNSSFSGDGKYYVLLNYYNTVEEIKQRAAAPGPYFNQFHVRGDLYEELGSPNVHDEESFFALMAQAKQKYPDLQPMVFLGRNPYAFANLVGLDIEFPTDAQGNSVHILSDPGYKEFARVINRAYREGYIMEENFSYTEDDQTYSHIAAGKVFMTTHYAGNDDQVLTSLARQSDPNASFIQMMPMDQFKATQDVSGWAGLFIPRSCKDPETAIKLLRWAKEPDNQNITMLGVKGTDWDYDADGALILLDRYNKTLEEGNIDAVYNPMHFVLSASDYITESAMFYAAATERTREVYRAVWPKLNFTNIGALRMPPAGSDERVISGKLGDLESEYFPKLGTAKTPEEFEAIYAELMQQAESIGIAAYNKYVSGRYQELSEQLGVK